jgi:signal peptidase
MKTTEMKTKVFRILNIVLNSLFYVVILLLLLFALANLKVKTTADIPSIFGRGFLTVLTPSMDGDKEDSFKEGDLIIVNLLNDNEKENLKIGDTITYYDSQIEYTTTDGIIHKGGLNTHRIVAIFDDFFITQGDKVVKDNPERAYDPNYPGNNADYYETVNKKDALAVHVSTWSGAGRSLQHLQTPAGFGVWIVIPTFIQLMIEAALLIRNVLKYNQNKTKDQLEKEKAVDLEKEKEILRQQILEELKKEQEEKKN